MKISQFVSPENKERIILMYLDGHTRKEIVTRLDISWWHINNVIYNFDKSTCGESYISETIATVMQAETKCIQLAVKLATNEIQNDKEFNSLLYGVASADIMNRSVFI